MEKKFLGRLDISAPESCYDRVAGILALDVSFGWEENSLPTGETVFGVCCDNSAFLDNLQAKLASISQAIHFERSEFEERPWQEAWKEFFTPVFCGTRFVALPPWLGGEDYGSRHKIMIEPEYAFGTGHHATTALCLQALGDLLDENRIAAGAEFLDLGCGSGILGIGAALAGMTGIGVDLDELAIANAAKNRDLNGCPQFRLIHGGIEQAGAGKFDLVMANILARPLLELAPAIVAAMAPGAALILSGILDIQADAVENAYRAQGLGKATRLADGEWRALVFHGGQ